MTSPIAHPLPVALAAAVPLEIARLRRLPLAARTAELDRLRAEAGDAAQVLAEHGDDLLFRGPHTARAFGVLVRSLALLAFAPGGVTVFGAHWEAGA